MSLIQVISLLSTDGHKLFEAVVLGSFLLATPVLFVMCAIYSCYVLYYTALAGVFIYAILIPLQVCMLNGTVINYKHCHLQWEITGLTCT